MFKLEDVRKTRVWQEAQDEIRKEMVQKLMAKGFNMKEVADNLDMPLKEVRKLMKSAASNGE